MNKEYKIKNISDLLDVPEDRINDCLEQMKKFLKYLRDITDMAKLVGGELGIDTKTVIESTGFVWIDDGKNDVTITIQPVIEKNIKSA
jgi:hypothetical protein